MPTDLGTGLSALLGLVVGAVLVIWDRLAELPTRRLVWAIVIAATALRVTFALSTPLFNAPDELPHFHYVQYLVEHRQFPVAYSPCGAATDDWEYFQPPLYYLACTPVYIAAQWLSNQDQDTTVRALRLLSVILWLLTLGVSLRLLQAWEVTQDRGAYLGAVALLCFVPANVFLTAMINNDHLLNFFAALCLYLLTRPQTPRMVVLIGVTAGVALLTKLSAAVLVVLAGAWLIIAWRRREMALRVAVGRMVAIAGLAVLIYLPWGLRNVALYGDWTAGNIAFVRYAWDSPFQALAVSLRTMVGTFWAAAGIYNHVGWSRHLGIPIMGLALAGLTLRLTRRGDAPRPLFSPPVATQFYAALCMAALVVATDLIHGGLHNQAQGRFLFVALPPFAWLLGLGLSGLQARLRWPQLCLGFAVFMATWALAFAGHVLRTLGA